jgi:poly-gamma-glutamate synthesis protein (capsule biosynthesis protein)
VDVKHCAPKRTRARKSSRAKTWPHEAWRAGNIPFLCLLLASQLLPFAPRLDAAPRSTPIETFDEGTVTLDSYPGQDHEPGAWELTSSNTFDDTPYALRIFGNTWKMEEISPYAISDSTVWQVAVYVERLGEMQAFGVSDGQNELLYTFAGEQLPQEEKWWTVYQGAFPIHEWYAYLLPIGEDWMATYGYLPTVTRLIYVNDDDAGQPGITVFDEIVDVTEDLPVPPEVTILRTTESTEKIRRGLYRVGVQFYGEVFDPDSQDHDFFWDFGDSSFSEEQNPYHEFLVEADYAYTVAFYARDPDGLVGWDTCQVRVEPGTGELPIRINFVGDVMTARTYEEPGGIIDTYGVEYIFEPTLPILGEAADVSVCNLECPYTNQGEPHPTKSVVFRSKPENIVGIAYAGIDVVDIGNNHIIDYGEVGMLQTQGLLDSLGIRWSGAGTNAYFALLPTFWTERGVRVAFLGQSNRTGRQWNYQPFLDAGYNKPGFAYELPKNLQKALDYARDKADVVILQLHSGDEYETEPPDRGRGKTLAAPPPVESAAIGPDDPDFRFPIEPSPGDRELRRMAIDLGADIVINHHPHVLQGFESYNGHLIAHSLGNFVFDLYYPETMPTIVLTLEIDKSGIVGYTFVPAWIDDNIPQPATGQLGREIMDRMADYSRDMGALVAVDPENVMARIYLDRSEADSTVYDQLAAAEPVEENGQWVSEPVRLAGMGNLSRIVSVTGDGLDGIEVRWGREILWHGNFEPEGATFWDTNTPDEWIEEGVSHGGDRSLALRRHAGDPGPTGTDLEKHLPSDPAREHTLMGWMRTENAAGAVFKVRFYANRYSSSPVSSEDVGPGVWGTEDWRRHWKDVATPDNGVYFEVRCHLDVPESGTAMAWFDDLALVEWEPWVPFEGPVTIPSPNNFRFVQVRAAAAASPVVALAYEETSYWPSPSSVPESVVEVSRPMLRIAPNPMAGRTRVLLRAPASGGPARVELFDVRGRKLGDLFRGVLAPSEIRQLFLDPRSFAGGRGASGVYFVRARCGAEQATRKVVLLR